MSPMRPRRRSAQRKSPAEGRFRLSDQGRRPRALSPPWVTKQLDPRRRLHRRPREEEWQPPRVAARGEEERGGDGGEETLIPPPPSHPRKEDARVGMFFPCHMSYLENITISLKEKTVHN
jgi:hypothetical protein